MPGARQPRFAGWDRCFLNRPWIEVLEDRILPSVGSLDLGFSGGQVLSTSGTTYNAVVVLRTNSDTTTADPIVSVGAGNGGNYSDFLLSRTDANGNPLGQTLVDFGSASAALAAASTPTGDIILAGFVAGSSGRNLALAEVNATSGALDTHFGSGGKVTLALGSDAVLDAVTVEGNGTIVAAGTVLVGGIREAAVVRLTASGALDPTFNNGQPVVFALGAGSATVGGVQVLPNGNIDVSGTEQLADSDVAVARLTSAGTLDSSFGSGGIATTDLGGKFTGGASALQGNGQLVVAGALRLGRFQFFALARFNSNGSLDTSFGAGTSSLGPAGTVTTAVGPIADAADAITIQPNGKIVAAGSSALSEADPSQTEFALVRYNINGSLDTTFGLNGRVVTSFASGSSAITGVDYTDDGKLVVAGNASGVGALARYLADLRPVTPGGTFSIALQASTQLSVTANDFDPDGDPLKLTGLSTTTLGGGNLSYDATGLVTWSGFSAGGPYSFTYTISDGWLTAQGTESITVTAIAYRAGDPDASLAGGPLPGFVVNQFGSSAATGNAVAVVPGSTDFVTAGSIVVSDHTEFLVARYLADGSLDTSFNATGAVMLDPGGAGHNDTATAVTVLANGSIVVAGTATGTGGQSELAVVELSSTGQLVSTFGTNGVGLLALPGGVQGLGLAVETDGLGNLLDVVVVGAAGAGASQQLVVARFLANGSLDTTFNGTGHVETTFGLQDVVGSAVVVASDGSVYVAGSAVVAHQEFLLAHFLSNGQLDTTGFNPSGPVPGTVETDVLGLGSAASSLVLVPLGSLGSFDLVASGVADGTNAEYYAAVRYHSDGSLDSGFGANGIVTVFPQTNLQAPGLAVQSDGDFILVGDGQPSGNNTIQLEIVRLTPTGQLDPTFGNGGLAGFNAPSPTFNGVVVDSSGEYLVVGSAFGNTQQLVARIHSTSSGLLPPTAPAITANTTVNQSVVIPVLSYAYDPNGVPLTDTDPPVSYTDTGTVVNNGNGTLTYTPLPGFTGEDEFTYTVSNGSSSATGTVTVNVVDPTPTLSSLVSAFDPTGLVTSATFVTVGGEDTTNPTPTVATAGVLNLDLPGAGTGPTAVLSTADLGVLTTLPDTGTNFNDVIAGARGQAYDATELALTFNVPAGLPANETYELTFDFTYASNEFPNQNSLPNGAANGFVAELDQSTWTVNPQTGQITAPNNFAYNVQGTPSQAITVLSSFFSSSRVELQTGTLLDGSTPLLEAHIAVTPGTHTLYLSIFGVENGLVGSAALLRNLRLTAVPVSEAVPGATQAPYAADQTAPLLPGKTTTVNLLANSLTFDGQALRVLSVGQAAHGTVALDPFTGQANYTPAPGYTGADSFSYTLIDAYGLTTTAIVQISPLVLASASASASPTGDVISADAGVADASLTKTTPGSDPSTLTVLQYASDPVGSFTANVFFDVQSLGSQPGDQVTVLVHDPTGQGELYYYTGQFWVPVLNYDGTLPTRLANGDLELILDSASNPRVNGLTGTVFALAAATPPPPSTTINAPVASTAQGSSATSADFRSSAQLSLVLNSSESATAATSQAAAQERSNVSPILDPSSSYLASGPASGGDESEEVPYFASTTFRKSILSEDGFNDFWEQETDQFWWMLDQILEDNQPVNAGDGRFGALPGPSRDALAVDLALAAPDGALTSLLTADLAVPDDTPSADTPTN
jgi:uncharacterized delta-60 repeat protein